MTEIEKIKELVSLCERKSSKSVYISLNISWNQGETLTPPFSDYRKNIKYSTPKYVMGIKKSGFPIKTMASNDPQIIINEMVLYLNDGVTAEEPPPKKQPKHWEGKEVWFFDKNVKGDISDRIELDFVRDVVSVGDAHVYILDGDPDREYHENDLFDSKNDLLERILEMVQDEMIP